MKALRISLLALLGIAVVAVAGAAIFVASFDANRYKPEIEQLVFDRTGRTLKIEGDIHLSIWPNIGAELGRTTLSEKGRAGSGDASPAAFLTITSSRVSVALKPLLSGQVLVDGLTIDGLSANITRDKGGAFNFADLTGTDSTQPHPAPVTGQRAEPSSLQLDISSIALTNARVNYTDQKQGLDLQVSDLNLQTGQIAPQASGELQVSARIESSAMALNTQIQANGDYKLDTPNQQIEFNGLTSKLTGDYQDIKSIDSTVNFNWLADLAANAHTLTDLDTTVKALLSGQALDLSFKTKQAQLKDDQVSADPSTLTLALKDQARSIDANLTLPAFTLAQNVVQLNNLTASVAITDPALGEQPLPLTVNGKLSINTESENITTTLDGQFDGSPMKANITVAGFGAPAITFDMALAQLKLDRFGQSATVRTSGTDDSTGDSTTAEPKAQATDRSDAIDLSALKGHNIKGKLSVDQVLSKAMVLDNLSAEMVLQQGKLSVAPHSAQLFGGALTGSFMVDANTNQFTIQENITDVKLEALLTALGQEPKVSGQGALMFDLRTTGSSVKSLEQNLAGTASVNLKDGTIKGIDIGAIINNVRGILGKAPTEQGAASGQTTFTELTATATLKNGIATNRDLNLKAPLFRLEGSGTANIPTSTLDYLAKVAVVETSSGQGGADLAALRGVTIPVNITGTFNEPRYRVDVASLASELAKSKLGDRARDEINKVVPGLGDALKGLFGR